MKAVVGEEALSSEDLVCDFTFFLYKTSMATQIKDVLIKLCEHAAIS